MCPRPEAPLCPGQQAEARGRALMRGGEALMRGGEAFPPECPGQQDTAHRALHTEH